MLRGDSVAEGTRQEAMAMLRRHARRSRQARAGTSDRVLELSPEPAATGSFGQTAYAADGTPQPRCHPPASERGWIDRPARGAWSVCIVAILVSSLLAAVDQLRHSCLAGDDFAYVADSRDASRLASNLFTPHNTHIVPLFRIWTFALVAGAGRLSNIAVLASGSD